MVSLPPALHAPDPPSPPREGEAWRARLRRAAMAWLLGAAVVVWPAWPSPAQLRSARPPAFERALRWRDIIRLRLSPWLLMQDGERSDRDHPPAS